MRVKWLVWRTLAPPCGSGVRRLVSFVAIAIAMSRFGLIAFQSYTGFPLTAYAHSTAVLGLLILATTPIRRSIYARIIATISAGVFAGMATDMIMFAGHLTLSSIILCIMSYAMIGEAAVNGYDC